MASPRYSELGMSLGILDNELPWYWRLLAHVSAWLLLAGFVVFPLAIDEKSPSLHGKNLALTALAFVLIALAYVGCVVTCVKWRRSTRLLDLIYMPCFGSSLVGLFNLVLNILVRQLQPLDALSLIAVTICAVSTAGYGAACIYHSHPSLFSTSRAKLKARRRARVDDAELQRRQLVRLYLKQDADRAPTPEVSQSTFRIEIPEAAYDENDDRVVTAPRQAYERRVNDYELANMRGRSSSPATLDSGRSLRRSLPNNIPEMDESRQPRRKVVELRAV